MLNVVKHATEGYQVGSALRPWVATALVISSAAAAKLAWSICFSTSGLVSFGFYAAFPVDIGNCFFLNVASTCFHQSVPMRERQENGVEHCGTALISSQLFSVLLGCAHSAV